MISAPACYGKLPCLGDYLHYAAPREEVATWWNRFAALQDKSRIRPSGLPWCFALAPGTFFWSGKRHIIGVLAMSEDRIGRPYPLVIWQKASVGTLRHDTLFGPAASPRNWLFWLARLVAAHIVALPDRPAVSGAQTFERHLAELWELYRPNWRALFGLTTPPPKEERFQALVNAPLRSDLEGVRFLPWADWPQRLWAPRPLCYFWQQDLTGRYLQAITDRTVNARLIIRLFAEP